MVASDAGLRRELAEAGLDLRVLAMEEDSGEDMAAAECVHGMQEGGRRRTRGLQAAGTRGAWVVAEDPDDALPGPRMAMRACLCLCTLVFLHPCVYARLSSCALVFFARATGCATDACVSARVRTHARAHTPVVVTQASSKSHIHCLQACKCTSAFVCVCMRVCSCACMFKCACVHLCVGLLSVHACRTLSGIWD